MNDDERYNRMNAWKMLSGLASMVAAAAVLTSVLTTYKNFNDSTFQPSGLICLGLAALVLGLAGIVQVVFRDGLIERARLVTVALFVLAAVLFLLTAILAFLDFNGWIQIITLIVWSVGCAAFAYVDYMWAYKISDSPTSAQESVNNDDVAEDDESLESATPESAGVSGGAAALVEDEVASGVEGSGDADASDDAGSALEDLPALPDVEDASEVSDSASEAAGDLAWDGVSGPPPRL